MNPSNSKDGRHPVSARAMFCTMKSRRARWVLKMTGGPTSHASPSSSSPSLPSPSPRSSTTPS